MADDDEGLILKYLSGFETTDKKGRPRTEYLKPGGQEELAAREALTTRLRSIKAFSDVDPLSFKIRQALASIFTPEDGWSERHPLLKFRSRGNRAKLRKAMEVAAFVLKEQKTGSLNREDAVQNAMHEYGLSRRAVYEKLRICAVPDDSAGK